jgi:hypothetical protein
VRQRQDPDLRALRRRQPRRHVERHPPAGEGTDVDRGVAVGVRRGTAADRNETDADRNETDADRNETDVDRNAGDADGDGTVQGPDGVISIDVGAIPIEVGAIPADVGVIPGDVGVIPIEVGAIPIEVGAVPDDVSAVPIRRGGRRRGRVPPRRPPTTGHLRDALQHVGRQTPPSTKACRRTAGRVRCRPTGTARAARPR